MVMWSAARSCQGFSCLVRELKFNRNSKIVVIMRSCRFLLDRSMKILWRTFDNGWWVETKFDAKLQLLSFKLHTDRV